MQERYRDGKGTGRGLLREPNGYDAVVRIQQETAFA
jgi:hypothetical protein